MNYSKLQVSGEDCGHRRQRQHGTDSFRRLEPEIRRVDGYRGQPTSTADEAVGEAQGRRKSESGKRRDCLLMVESRSFHISKTQSTILEKFSCTGYFQILNIFTIKF